MNRVIYEDNIKYVDPDTIQSGICFTWPSNMKETKELKTKKEKVQFLYKSYKPALKKIIDKQHNTPTKDITFFPITITMHEGQETYSINSPDDFPDDNLPCPCGDPNCWLVYYDEQFIEEIKTFVPEFVL